MKNIQFELTTEIPYANGSGAEIKANFIELREPTGKVSHLCCDLESLIQSGILKMKDMLDDATLQEAAEKAKETKASSEDDKIDRESILSMMTGGGVDMKRAVVSFRELFKEVAFVGGEKAMTIPMMDKMSHTDFRDMMGEYAANFIMR